MSELNGKPKPLSMMVSPGFDKDPLRPKVHHVVNGRGEIVHKSSEPIELLRLNAEKQHAVFAPNEDIVIIDEDRTVVHQVGSYYVEPEEGPPDEERCRLRDKWMDNVLRFLLQKNPRLLEHRNDPAWQRRIAKWLRARDFSIEMRPDGGAVRVLRDGAVLCSWGC